MSIWRMLAGYFLALLFAIPIGLAMGIRNNLIEIKTACIFFISPLLLLFVWQFVVNQGFVSDQLLPSPWQIALQLMEVTFSLDFLKNLAVTVFRLLTGLSLAIFPILMATWAAAQGVDKKLIWSAQAAGTSKGGLVYKVYLPAILPSLMAGIRVASVIACVVVFLAEMIAATDGLGHMLTTAARSYIVVDMFVPLVWICAIGMTLNYGIGKIQKKISV